MDADGETMEEAAPATRTREKQRRIGKKSSRGNSQSGAADGVSSKKLKESSTLEELHHHHYHHKTEVTVPKRPQKLYPVWGLDSKERWERKANMY
ncbi:hypothetical protein HID58_050755, partial [Brassica napus]